MDIKGPLASTIIRGVRSVDRVDKDIKSDRATADRDANGQQFTSSEDQHPPMSDEQFEKAMQALKDLPGVKDSSIEIKEEIQNGLRFVSLIAPDGKLIRRLRELDLWSFIDHKDPSNKGKILNKAA